MLEEGGLLVVGGGAVVHGASVLEGGVVVIGGGALEGKARVVAGGAFEGGAMVVGGGTVEHVHGGGGGGGGVGRWKITAPVASTTAKKPPAALETSSEQGLVPP